jgi:hypothetical protein
VWASSFRSTPIRSSYMLTTDFSDVRALEAERSGSTMEFKASLDINDTLSDLRRAVKCWGSVKKRIEQHRDFESDVDLYQIRRARNSRLLHLLEFELIYLAFVYRPTGNSPDNHGLYLWADPRQGALGQYWQLCDCKRRRKRSRSINEMSSFTYVSREELPRPKLKQRLITEWVARTSVPPEPLPSCHPSCPCVEANKRGPAETAAWESKLFICKDLKDGLQQFETKGRYRNFKRWKGPSDEDDLFLMMDSGSFWWVQPEFANGEVDGEN